MRKTSLLVLTLILLAAGVASAAQIEVTLTAEIPTFLTMDLSTGGSTVATADQSADGTYALNFGTPGTAPDGTYLESGDYVLTVISNNNWSLGVTGGVLSSGSGTVNVEWKYSASSDLTLVPWSTPADATHTYTYEPLTAAAGVVRYFRFGIPYTWAQRAGTYIGTVTLAVTTI